MFFIVFVIWAVCSWDAFWNLTWLYFGRVLGAKMGPSGYQMALDIDPKSNQKNDCHLHGFKIEFYWFLAPTWEVQGGSNYQLLEVFLRSWNHLGTKMAPRPAKRPQDSSQDWFFRDLGPQHDGFWAPTWWFLGRFGDPSWLIGAL